MKQYTIEIEGLPEGWDAVAYRIPKRGEQILDDSGIITATSAYIGAPWLIVKKKQPRRIVLEETDFEFDYEFDGVFWREVKEIDLSLHNADDKESFRLSVDECKQILGYINDNNSIFLKLANFVSERKLHHT